MNFLKLNDLKKFFFELNSFQIFILSFLICSIFYLAEGMLGVDRFYHPDSKYYLKNMYNVKFQQFLSNPTILVHKGFHIVTNSLNNNYYLIILVNFILYSLTNVLIYQKIFKKYFNIYSNIKLIFLFYLLFLDPYRLHLASHILKETFLIFIIIVIVTLNLKIIKLIFILLLEVFRKYSWIYLFIFFTYSNLKKFLKLKIFYITSIVLVISFLILILIDQNIYKLIYNEFEKVINFMKMRFDTEMPLRSYDHVTQFRDYGFPAGFILKTVSWTIMLISGFFMLFVSSLMFKFLGIIILFNNLLIYFITKRSFISIGLIIILLMLSIYTTSYTSMFRYSYIAVYSAMIYFFLNLNFKNFKQSD